MSVVVLSVLSVSGNGVFTDSFNIFVARNKSVINY